jgi:hypothetical protein
MARDTPTPRFSPQSFTRDPRGFEFLMTAVRTRFCQGATARPPREDDFAGDRWHGFRDRSAICHSRLAEAIRAMKTDVQFQGLRAAEPQKLRFHAIWDHDSNVANGAMQLIAGRLHFRAKVAVIRRSGTGPARSGAGRVPSLFSFAIDPHRQPAIPDGRRSAK